MQRFTSSIRRPVKRPGAETYLLITLFSFAASVTFVRLLLSLTGYPQLGGGELHIAHVLWGGLLLFIASLLPLIFANRWVYTFGAAFSGAGVGLFIDEVGKFITQSNDYFYPLAAPIIYAFFLLTVLLYLRIRRPPPQNPRQELYASLDRMEEVLEHDLDEIERADLSKRLDYVANQDQEPVLAHLARSLAEVIHWEMFELAPPRSTLLTRLIEAWRHFDQRFLTRRRLRLLLVISLIGLGLLALANMAWTLSTSLELASLEGVLQQLLETGQVTSPTSLNWFLARVALETAVGLMLYISAGLFMLNRDRAAVNFGYIALLLSLTAINLLVFYFDQFSAILIALVQFTVLTGLLFYRRKFLSEPLI